MEQALRKLAPVFGVLSGEYDAVDWGAVDHAAAQDARNALIEEGLGPRTVNKLLSALRGVLEAAWRDGVLPDERYRRIELKNMAVNEEPAGRVLDEDEIRRLLSAADHPRDAALVAVLYGAGLRRAEAAAMRRDDYDPVKNEIKVMKGKGRKFRRIPIAREWKAPIAEWHGRLSVGSPMFPVDSERRSEIRGITPSGVAYLVEQLGKAAGLEAFTPHDLRRSFATHLLSRGVDSLIVQQLMGHANLSTTAIYDRRGEAAAREAVEKLSHRTGEG